MSRAHPQMIAYFPRYILKAACSSLLDCQNSFIGASQDQSNSNSTLQNRQARCECKPSCRSPSRSLMPFPYLAFLALNNALFSAIETYEADHTGELSNPCGKV